MQVASASTLIALVLGTLVVAAIDRSRFFDRRRFQVKALAMRVRD